MPFHQALISCLTNPQSLTFCLLLFFQISIQAQPIPCGPDPMMTPTCQQACVICDIDGFTGINDSQVQGVEPTDFCTGTVHNITWIAFIAGSTDLKIDFNVFDCDQGDGLEVGIFYSLDCENFQSVSNCDGDVDEGQTLVLMNSVPLVIGQYYFLVIDGNMGDICHYKFEVTLGTTLVQPLFPSGVIGGPTDLCKGKVATYTLPPVAGANFYQWSVDGVPFPPQLNPNKPIEWNTAGTHQLCVTAYNVCDTLEPICQTITVTPLPPTDMFATICYGDSITVGTKILFAEGIFPVTLNTADDCDSLVKVHLTIMPPIVTDLSFTLCEGDSIQIGDQFFDATGSYSVVLPSYQNCDSTVNLALTIQPCPLHGSTVNGAVPCHGDSTGVLSFTMTDGLGPYSFSWEKVSGSPLYGAGVISLQTLGTATIPNLPAGLYSISLTDADGKNGFLSGSVFEPTALSLGLALSQFGAFQISCTGESDGSITATASGGTTPYLFLWSNGSTADTLTALAAGTYSLTLTDASGCFLEKSISLAEPAPLHLLLKITEPTCVPKNSGSIVAEPVAGGMPPYLFNLNGGSLSSIPQFTDLLPGDYSLLLEDANGCSTLADTSLATPEPLGLEIGNDQNIFLGDSLRLKPQASMPIEKYAWQPAASISCPDCQSPWAKPLVSTTYFLTATMANGCSATDSLRVTVIPRRRVFVPNAFSPNDDGDNDRLVLFGGGELLTVRSFRAYSRWGELLVELENVAPNDFLAGWDGRFRGKPLPADVYTWVAEVEFLDGVVEQFQGDVTLVR